MPRFPRAPNATAPAGRGASARGWAWLLALLLALQGFAWATHAASHAVPTAACAAAAVTVADHAGDAHCSGGACVTCHALSLFDGAPPAGPVAVTLSLPLPVPAGEAALPLPRRALPWARSRAPPVPA